MALSSRNLHLNKKDLDIARSVSSDLIKLKKRLNKKNDINKFIYLKKKELNNNKDVKIEYLELRNKFSLKKSQKINDSKIFIAYYIKKVRLIDNF